MTILILVLFIPNYGDREWKYAFPTYEDCFAAVEQIEKTKSQDYGSDGESGKLLAAFCQPPQG